ncbi:MAG: class I SAM-dependent methyltransferase [Anaerolineae bacterium]|nr:class I SAM-dependent methyltransferase [Anaerolineae bacterium]
MMFEYRSICDICGSEQAEILLSLHFTDPLVWNFLANYYENKIDRQVLIDTKYELVKCRQCGFIWQPYILNSEGMDMLYNQWISAEQSKIKKQEADIALYSGYARQVELIAYLLKKKPSNIDILDFGMGWGYWCMMAKAFGYKVAGAEISLERIAYAQNNGVEVIEDITQVGERRFDFINAEQVFEHINQPLYTLNILVGLLKKDGIIRLSVPNGQGIESAVKKVKWRPIHDAVHPLEHINCFTNKTLMRMAGLAGLVPIQQPHMLGQGLLGKSYNRNLKSWVTSLGGKYYRRYWGTTLYFQRS